MRDRSLACEGSRWTITTNAAPRSGGNSPNSSCRARIPPAEAPTPMTGGLDRDPGPVWLLLVSTGMRDALMNAPTLAALAGPAGPVAGMDGAASRRERPVLGRVG